MPRVLEFHDSVATTFYLTWWNFLTCQIQFSNTQQQHNNSVRDSWVRVGFIFSRLLVIPVTLPDTQCMVYLPTFTIKKLTKCSDIYIYIPYIECLGIGISLVVGFFGGETNKPGTHTRLFHNRGPSQPSQPAPSISKWLQHEIPSLKLTWHLKMDGWNTFSFPFG